MPASPPSRVAEGTLDGIRQHGQYFTKLANPFRNPAFQEWALLHRLHDTPVLEPFAGENTLIEMLQSIGLAKNFAAYDIHPQSDQVQPRDTIQSFPRGHDFCVTNPPWLYKSSASRRRLPFPETSFDDLYKHALDLCLQGCSYVAALLPASYIQSGLFLDRLERLIFVGESLFENTNAPTCLALFGNTPSENATIFRDHHRIGEYRALQSSLPPKAPPALSRCVRFNVPTGALGLIAIDNTVHASIRFCHGEQLANYPIKHSARAITRIDLTDHNDIITDEFIARLNDRLDAIRRETDDVFLTTFKGLRQDGRYRRRIEFQLARNIIGACLPPHP